MMSVWIYFQSSGGKIGSRVTNLAVAHREAINGAMTVSKVAMKG